MHKFTVIYAGMCAPCVQAAWAVRTGLGRLPAGRKGPFSMLCYNKTNCTAPRASAAVVGQGHDWQHTAQARHPHQLQLRVGLQLWGEAGGLAGGGRHAARAAWRASPLLLQPWGGS